MTYFTIKKMFQQNKSTLSGIGKKILLVTVLCISSIYHTQAHEGSIEVTLLIFLPTIIIMGLSLIDGVYFSSRLAIEKWSLMCV